MTDNFLDKIGWALGAIILFIVFLVVGRVRVGRSSGRAPKWQHPLDRGDKPDRPEGYGRKRFVQARGPNREKKRDKREGGKDR